MWKYSEIQIDLIEKTHKIETNATYPFWMSTKMLNFVLLYKCSNAQMLWKITKIFFKNVQCSDVKNCLGFFNWMPPQSQASTATVLRRFFWTSIRKAPIVKKILFCSLMTMSNLQQWNIAFMYSLGRNNNLNNIVVIYIIFLQIIVKVK